MTLEVGSKNRVLALLKGRWQASEASEHRRLALLPRMVSPGWEALMTDPAYLQALSLIP